MRKKTLMQRLLGLPIIALALVCLVHIGQAQATSPDYCKLLPQVSNADPDKDPRLGALTREEICRSYYWTEFKAAPAEQLLPVSQLADYRSALKSADCDSPLKLIKAAFARTYPSAPSILADEVAYESWRDHTVGTKYPDVAICLERRRFSDLENEIESEKLTAARYLGLTTSLAPQIVAKLPELVMQRHMLIYAWELRVERIDHLETALTLLQLSREGKALRYDPATEAYLALHLKAGGFSEPAIDEILADHAPDDIVQMEQQTRNRSFRAIRNYMQ
ncbi:MAG: hypothetical protein RIC14_05125 [Filomicrobium sp.]